MSSFEAKWLQKIPSSLHFQILSLTLGIQALDFASAER